MSGFERSTCIKAPVASVWEVLADIGSIADWNPGVVRSYVTGDRAGEVGSARHCDLGGKNYLDEEVVEWEEGRLLTMRVVGSNMPFKTAHLACRSARVASASGFVHYARRRVLTSSLMLSSNPRRAVQNSFLSFSELCRRYSISRATAAHLRADGLAWGLAP